MRTAEDEYPLDPAYRARLQRELNAAGWPFGDVLPDAVWNEIEQEWELPDTAEEVRPQRPGT